MYSDFVKDRTMDEPWWGFLQRQPTSFSIGIKWTRPCSWPLTSIQWRRSESVELYPTPSIRLRGVHKYKFTFYRHEHFWTFCAVHSQTHSAVLHTAYRSPIIPKGLQSLLHNSCASHSHTPVYPLNDRGLVPNTTRSNRQQPEIQSDYINMDWGAPCPRCPAHRIQHGSFARRRKTL